MPKYSSPRPRGSESDEETLRGQARELRKEVQRLNNFIKHLQKQLRRYEDDDKDKDEENEKEIENAIKKGTTHTCRKCKSENVTTLPVKKLNEPITIVICQDCGDRETLKA